MISQKATGSRMVIQNHIRGKWRSSAKYIDTIKRIAYKNQNRGEINSNIALHKVLNNFHFLAK